MTEGARPFQKGGPSPNPAGRPRLSKRERFRRLLDLVLSENVNTSDGAGRTRRITKLEALITQLVALSLKEKSATKAHRLLAKVQKRRGHLEPESPADERRYGVLVVEPYMSPDEWEAHWSARKRSPDPLDGLPGIDREALGRAIQEKQRLQERGYEEPGADPT